MNNSIFAVRTPTPLVRMWRTVNGPGSPLVCIWVEGTRAKQSCESATDQTGGLLRCA